MPTYDPLDAALDALVAHFGTALAGTVTVRKGFPEANVELDVSTLPVLSVALAGDPEIERCTPGIVDETAADGVVTVTWRVAYLRARVQLDLWAAYKVVRTEKAPLVEAALRNRVPRSTDLWLTSTNYFSRPITARVTGGGRIEDDAEGVQAGLWRRSWDLVVSTDFVHQGEQPQLAELTLSLSTTPGLITEPDVVITS